MLEECAATPPSSPPAVELAEAAEFAYWMDSLPGGLHGAGRLTLALDNRERDQVYQQSTRQNWRALQQAGVGYCTHCFAQCLSEHLGWTSSDADGGQLVLTSSTVAWLYQHDPSFCTSFTAACPRCQHSVLPATSLPAATPGCDAQLEHRILLTWCYRDHYLQGLAWRLWRTGRSWRRLLVVVLAANRLGLAWLESNAQRYAPGGPGQVQAGIQFATASSQLELREEVAQLGTDTQRETQTSAVSVFLFVCASPPLPSISASVAVALRPTATSSTTLAAAPRQCICGAHGNRCINWTDPMGVGQRRFLCAQCLQPCGCLCGGCDVYDYTTDAIVPMQRSAWTSCSVREDRRRLVLSIYMGVSTRGDFTYTTGAGHYGRRELGLTPRGYLLLLRHHRSQASQVLFTSSLPSHLRTQTSRLISATVVSVPSGWT